MTKSTKLKVIYRRSTKSGFNNGDSRMLEPDEAAKVVHTGDAYYEKPLKPKSKEKAK